MAMKRATELRVRNRTIPFTPKMYDALSELARGADLDADRTHVGRPTKQRLAKFGLAEFKTPKDWDGPMVITFDGKIALDLAAKH